MIAHLLCKYAHEPLLFDWNDLRYLIAIARGRSLSAAATRLNVRHTTVARRLEALESAVGATLFERTPAGYQPTPAGTKLLAIAEAVETQCISAADVISGQDSVLSGTVRMGVPEGFGSFLASRLSSFHKAYPGLDLEMVAGTQFLNITKREADLAISLSRPRAGRLVSRKLCDYALRLYGARAYLKRHPPIRSLADLKSHTLIGYIDDLIPAPQLRYLDEILPQARVALRTSSINAQMAAVEAGLGLCFLHCFMADTRPALAPVLPDEVTVTRTFWLSMHQDLRQVRRVEAVWNWLTELVAREHQLLNRGS